MTACGLAIATVVIVRGRSAAEGQGSDPRGHLAARPEAIGKPTVMGTLEDPVMGTLEDRPLCAHARTRSAGLVLRAEPYPAPEPWTDEAKQGWGAAPNPARGRAPGHQYLRRIIVSRGWAAT